jgi:hypothetical protein
MRLWSIHPMYLDCRGLVALWRESLLARAVLRGETIGYRNHPQLVRFQERPEPDEAIEFFLTIVQREGARRGYAFDASKLEPVERPAKIPVTDGQIRYETCHLAAKLERRDAAKAIENARIKMLAPHPLFKVIAGEVEPWERT